MHSKACNSLSIILLGVSILLLSAGSFGQHEINREFMRGFQIDRERMNLQDQRLNDALATIEELRTELREMKSRKQE